MRIAANGTLFLMEEGKKEPTCFFIEGEPKRGGSCLVYSVRWQQAGTMFRGILKECYPSEWGNLPAIERKENGQLFIPEAWMEAYQNQLTKMRQAYELQMRISLQDHLVNRVVEERGIYYGCYGACYSLMAYADGVSYEQVKDSNLKQTLETLLSVARFLKIYHDAGYVHLDIKPENLLILPETRQLVKVLDYDSSVSLEELHTKMVRLSRSEQWEAPELAAFASGSGMTEREWMRKQRRIGIYTDQYPLGRILAKRLGIPEQLDHSIPKNWLWETNHPWLEEVRPCVREKLQQFFSHTLAIATQNRYPSDEALIAALEELVAVSDPTAIFLRSSYLEKKATFYGREDELKQMERLQKERKRIFLTGMGGIGKSELARTYGMGLEMEFDGAAMVNSKKNLRNQGLMYMDAFRRNGVFRNSALAYYEGGGSIYRFSRSDVPEDKQFIDTLAYFIQKRRTWLGPDFSQNKDFTDSFDSKELNKDYWNKPPRNKAIVCKKGKILMKGEAQINTKGKRDMFYGRIEVTARINTKAKNAEATIRMMPVEGKLGEWPNSGDMQLMRYQSEEGNRIHIGANTKQMNVTDNRIKESIYELSPGYHTFACEWSEQDIIFTVDGITVNIQEDLFQRANNPYYPQGWPFNNEPFYLEIMTSGEQGETILEIDSVKMFFD